MRVAIRHTLQQQSRRPRAHSICISLVRERVCVCAFVRVCACKRGCAVWATLAHIERRFVQRPCVWRQNTKSGDSCCPCGVLRYIIGDQAQQYQQQQQPHNKGWSAAHSASSQCQRSLPRNRSSEWWSGIARTSRMEWLRWVHALQCHNKYWNMFEKSCTVVGRCAKARQAIELIALAIWTLFAPLTMDSAHLRKYKYHERHKCHLVYIAHKRVVVKTRFAHEPIWI